jgi:ABC-2 type transport system permease protein
VIGVIASEWTKLRSLRSTYVSLLAALAVSVAGGVFSAAGRAHEWGTMSAGQRAEFDPVNLSFDGLAFAQLAFALLGVLAVTSEYSTGLVRSTFTAVPRRPTVLLAKIVAVGGVTLVLGEVFSLLAFLAAQRALAAEHLGVGLFDDQVPRAVAGAGLYLAALALVGLGVGAAVRHTAGAVSAIFFLVFLLPVLAPSVSAWTTVPQTWNLWAAGNALITTLPAQGTQPTAWMGLLICAVYAVAALGLGCAVVTRRDV